MKYVLLLLLTATTAQAAQYQSTTKTPLKLRPNGTASARNMHLEVAPRYHEIDARQLLFSGAITTVGATWLAGTSKQMLFKRDCPQDRLLNGMVEYALPITLMTHGLAYSMQALGVDLLTPAQEAVGNTHVAFGLGAWGVLTASYFFRKEPNKIIGTFLAAAPFVALGVYDMQAADGSVLHVRF